MATATASTRRRKVSSAPSTDRTVRLNASIPAETWQRLVLHATMTGETQAAIIARLIEENLRSYRVQYLGDRKASEEPSDPPASPSPEYSSATAAV